jgi:hypothetical protein
MLLPELWQIILNLLDHDTLIIMDQVCTFITSQMIDTILKERRLLCYPRLSGKAKKHIVPFDNIYIKDCKELILKFLYKTRADLVKGDIITTTHVNNFKYMALYDEHTKLQHYFYQWFEPLTLPKPFDLINDNISIEYWDSQFENCNFVINNYKQELINNVIYDDNIIMTTITKNNKRYKFIFEELSTFLKELNNNVLYCYIEDDDTFKK